MKNLARKQIGNEYANQWLDNDGRVFDVRLGTNRVLRFEGALPE